MTLNEQMIVVVVDSPVVHQAKKYNLKYESPSKFMQTKATEYPEVFTINKADLKDLLKRADL